MRFKNIKNNGKTFLYRLSCKFKKGSIKIHFIVDDDVKFHTHPWDFKSLILFGGYTELREHDVKTYGWLSVNKKGMNELHWVVLRKLFGFKVPTLTIGIYGEKKQLCSLCQELGYCQSQKQKQQKECDHDFVPVGEYDQNGRFICTKCNKQI